MHRGVGLVLVGALALGIVGCSNDDSPSKRNAAKPNATSATTTTSTTVASTLMPGDRYVALGSSIASGFGISVQSACGRSSRDYGQLIAAKYRLELVDVSCGAAVIPNVLDTPQNDNPPQIQALTPDTKLVTVSVGGNDIGYNASTLVCGDPTNVCSLPPSLDADLAALPGKLRTMLDRIEAAAPSATIVYVTYPREIPDRNCAALSFTDAERANLESMGARLEAAEVAGAKRPGVVFVDPYVAPGDHTGCAPESERWTAGHVATDGFPYHPTALGHQVMAAMVEHALGS